jgi:hypothetical protein
MRAGLLAIPLLIGMQGALAAAQGTRSRTSVGPAMRPPQSQPATQPATQPQTPATTGSSDAGLASRDQAVDRMRALSAGGPDGGSTGPQNRITVFAPGGQALLQAAQSRAAVAADEAAQARLQASASQGLVSVEPGFKSLNGRLAGGEIVVATPATVIVTGLTPQAVCSLQFSVLSRELPARFPVHHDLGGMRRSAGAREIDQQSAPASAAAPAQDPEREIALTIVGGDTVALCQQANLRPTPGRDTYAISVLIPEFFGGQPTGGFTDDPAAAIEARGGDGATYQLLPITLVAKRAPLILPVFKGYGLEQTYKVVWGDWKPPGQIPYRFAEGESIDCPAPGGADHIRFDGLKNGFVLVSAEMLSDRIDTGDHDGFGNAGSRTLFSEYAVAFDGANSFWARWGVWRSHRSPIGAVSAYGTMTVVRPAHDICLSSYGLSVTLLGPVDVSPW